MDPEREVDPICPFGPSGCECYRKADEERGILAAFVMEEVRKAAEHYEQGLPLPCGCICHKGDDWDDRIGRP